MRLKRAAWRRRIRRAPLRAAVIATVALIRGRPSWADGWAVADAVRCLPEVGETRSAGFLRRAGIPVGAAVGALTDAQRAALTADLRGYLERVEARRAREVAA